MIYCTIPALGRFQLLRVTIQRLKKQTIPVKIIVLGDEDEAEKIAKDTGSEYLKVNNNPLGNKWQTGVEYCKKFDDLEAWIYLGSSDWISDNWCETMLNHIRKDADMVGVEDIFFLDIAAHNKKRMMYWPGYVGEREGESIGTGRMLGRNILEKINWLVFNRELDNSLDASMMNRLYNKGKAKVRIDDKSNIFCLSISTYRWRNNHVFADLQCMAHTEKVSGENMNELIDKVFPEAENMFNEK